MTKDQSPAELLTAGLIHELRHPLMGIKLGLQLIQREVGAPMTSQAEWPMVLSQIARLEELLRSYQRFLSPDLTGPAVFELAPVMADAIALCQLRLKKLGDRFTYRAPPGGVYAHGTPDALTHALTNILFNALDSVEAKGNSGRISVCVMPSANNDGRIEVRVSDEGTGIPPEIAERIFEPRFSTKARDQGSGLGLSIARRMMEAAGGEVTVVDRDDLFREPWAATEFRIALWAQLPARAAVLASAAAVPAKKALPKILLVEDDAVICAMLQKGLEVSGYEVTPAGTAERAIELLGSNRYDAVVTDKNLPNNKSGEDVARALRAQTREAALVMITAYASRESAREMQLLRADGYLPKPFEIFELVVLLGQVIARRQGQASVLARIIASPKAVRIHRIAVVEPDPKDRARLEKLLRDLKLSPLVRDDVSAVLNHAAAYDALIVNSAALTDVLKQRLLDLQIARPEFRIVLISPVDTMQESISSILLNAGAQLLKPWKDAHAAEELRRALDPRAALR